MAKRFEQTLKVAIKHLKKYSTSLVIEIKTTMRYHYIFTRTTIIKKVITVIDEVEEKLGLLFSWCQCKIVQPPRKIIWHFFKMLNINLPQYLEILFLSSYPRKMKIHVCTKIYRQIFIKTFFCKMAKSERNLSVHQQKNG